ncbi:MAG: MFS transporter [Actinomycetota bacterium]|nr:MFS transporter [Actinomycetota bacterium]
MTERPRREVTEEAGHHLAPIAIPPSGPGVVSPLKRPEFRKLLAVSITVALGFGMVIPVLPLLAESFGVGLAAIGLVQLVFGLTRFSFGLVGGLVVDRFGERASTMAGLLIVAISSYAAGFAATFPQLVLARGFGGAGSALFIAGLMNRILRIIEPEAMGRATGAFRSSFLVGIAAGPVLGGIVARRFGLAAPFHFYATGLLFAAVIAHVVMGGEESKFRRERRSPLEALRAARPLLHDIRYVAALLATFVGWWTVSGPSQIVGVVYAKNRLGLSAEQIGLAITMLAVGEVLILWVAGRASDRYGRRSVLVPSLAVVGVATLLMGQIQPVPWAFFPLMIAIGAGVAAGGTAAGGLLADAIPAEGSGAAVGVNQMAGDLGYLIAPSLIGAVAESSLDYEGAYVVGALPALLMLFIALRLPRGAGRGTGADTEAHEHPVEPHEPVG